MSSAVFLSALPTILVVDDDISIRESLRCILGDISSVYLAQSGDEALQILRNNRIDIIFLDLNLPDTNGLQILEIAKKFFPSVDIVIITINSDVSTVVKAIKGGAFDYINKDIEPNKIKRLIEIIQDKRTKENELLYLKNELQTYTDRELIFGNTARMLKIRELITKISDLPTTVLIQGETGTGKELVAREIHRQSRYKNSPFVSVNLAALPKELTESILFGHEKGAFTGAVRQTIGKFELAHNGILFLDEIGELEYQLQPKLLRVIQEGEIERVGSAKPIKLDVRLIAATSRDLEKMIASGTFRKDLYYRLNIIPIKLPPLRERLEDIEQLCMLFIARHARRFGKNVASITEEAIRSLKAYDWPGNIRELENLIERIIAVSDKIAIEETDIPFEYFLRSMNTKFLVPQLGESKRLLKTSMETFERTMIARGLEINNNDLTKTALMLGIPLSTLKFRMKKLTIKHYREAKKVEDIEIERTI